MIAAQSFEAFIKGSQRLIIAVALVPDFRLQENVTPVANAFANAILVFVESCGVDQPVTHVQRGFHRPCRSISIHLERAETQLGNPAFVIQRKCGRIEIGRASCRERV